MRGHSEKGVRIKETLPRGTRGPWRNVGGIEDGAGDRVE